MDPLMQHLTGCGEETNVPLSFVHIDANMFHGRSPLCGTDRLDLLWRSTLPRQVDQPLHLIIYPSSPLLRLITAILSQPMASKTKLAGSGVGVVGFP